MTSVTALSTAGEPQPSRQFLEPAPRAVQYHDAVNRTGRIAPRFTMLHNKHGGPCLVLNRGHAIRPCHSGCHIARSTLFAQHAMHFYKGSLSIIVQHARLGINSHVLE